jgi:hypothetical protein
MEPPNPRIEFAGTSFTAASHTTHASKQGSDGGTTAAIMSNPITRGRTAATASETDPTGEASGRRGCAAPAHPHTRTPACLLHSLLHSLLLLLLLLDCPIFLPDVCWGNTPPQSGAAVALILNPHPHHGPPPAHAQVHAAVRPAGSHAATGTGTFAALIHTHSWGEGLQATGEMHPSAFPSDPIFPGNYAMDDVMTDALAAFEAKFPRAKPAHITNEPIVALVRPQHLRTHTRLGPRNQLPHSLYGSVCCRS